MLGQIEIAASTQTDFTFIGQRVYSDDRVCVWESIDEKTLEPYRFAVVEVLRTPKTAASGAPGSEKGTLILCNLGDWDRVWTNIVKAGNFNPNGETLQAIPVDLDLATDVKAHLEAGKIP